MTVQTNWNTSPISRLNSGENCACPKAEASQSRSPVAKAAGTSKCACPKIGDQDWRTRRDGLRGRSYFVCETAGTTAFCCANIQSRMPSSPKVKAGVHEAWPTFVYSRYIGFGRRFGIGIG